MVRVYDTSSECALQMYESKIRRKDHKSIQSNTTPDPGFVEISLTVGYQIIEQTQICDEQTYAQMQEENILARVKVLVHDTSSE